MCPDDAGEDYGVVPFDKAMLHEGPDVWYYRRLLPDGGEKRHWILNVTTPDALRASKRIHLYASGYMLFANIVEPDEIDESSDAVTGCGDK